MYGTYLLAYLVHIDKSIIPGTVCNNLAVHRKCSNYPERKLHPKRCHFPSPDEGTDLVPFETSCDSWKKTVSDRERMSIVPMDTAEENVVCIINIH